MAEVSITKSINLVTEIPGPKSRAIVARREAAMSKGAAKLTPIAIEAAHGALVTDVDGNTLLDFAGGIGTLAVGHTPGTVVDALSAQAEKLIHMCAIVSTYEPFVKVAELLNDVIPGDFEKKTVLLNSGAEAVEAAVKVARAYTGRQAVLVFEGAYHGRTSMTMAMTSKWSLFKKSFGPFAPEVYRIHFPNVYRRPAEMSEESYINYCIWQLENAFVAYVHAPEVACVVIEPVQGEGGFIPVPARYLQRLRELCDEHGIVMIADEVQCGFGRTGQMFTMDHYDVKADITITGKSLAAGMPLAAITGRAEIIDAPHPGGLGGTYSGNPLACVAAIEAIEMIRQPDFLAHARAVGARIRSHLERIQMTHPNYIGDVRGLGPMLVMECVRDAGTKEPFADLTNRIAQETLQRGLITIRAGLYSNCIRFLPPLNVPLEQIDEGMVILEQAVDAAVLEAPNL